MNRCSPVNVLIIDDDTSFAELTKTFLEEMEMSFEVSVESSGRDGVEYFEENDVECIVCDYEMPGMDGLDVLESIRESSSVPFILFTGRGSEAVASDAFSKGATDYLQKSGSKSEFELLANRIMQYVEKYELESERKRVLKEKNRLLNRVDDAFVSLNDDFEVMHLNDRSISLLNQVIDKSFSYDEVIGESVWEILPSATGKKLERETIQAVEEREPSEFEVYYDPLEIWVDVKVYPSDDGASIFLRDVSERKESEEARENEREILFNLYGIASDQSLEYEERLSRAVRLGRDFLGVSFGFITSIQNQKQEIILSENRVENPELSEGSVCPIDETYCQHVLNQQEPMAVGDAKSEGFDGTDEYERFGLESYVSQKIYVSGEVYGTICFADFEAQDSGQFSANEMAITELLAAWVGYEIERKQSQDELKAQNKRLEAFAGFISHDLRNPLNVAEGYLEVEREERDSDNLERVQNAHERMETMITEMLEFARSSEELNDRSEVSIRSLCNDAWSNLQTGNSTLTVSTDRVVNGDCGKLLNVFENLFRNSIEHNDDPVEVTVSDTGRGVSIADDGVGLPSDKDLFKYESGQGGHFGLLITEEIVKAHGWRIRACESDNGGARFDIIF